MDEQCDFEFEEYEDELTGSPFKQAAMNEGVPIRNGLSAVSFLHCSINWQ